MGPGVQKGHFTLTIVVFSMALAACIENGEDTSGNNNVTLSDAYCVNGTFQFVLTNEIAENISLEYAWSLNDPKADRPVFAGAGELNLTPSGTEIIVISFENASYDSRYFVMCVNGTIDGKSDIRYRQQKSPHDWDYSELPPKRK